MGRVIESANAAATVATLLVQDTARPTIDLQTGAIVPLRSD